MYSGGTGRPYLVEGIGEDFWPGTYDGSVVDEIVEVSDRDSFLIARSVTRTEGLLVGGSTGTAVWAALHVGRRAARPRRWSSSSCPTAAGATCPRSTTRTGWPTSASCGWVSTPPATSSGRKRADLPALVHVHPDETVRTAIEILREYDV